MLFVHTPENGPSPSRTVKHDPGPSSDDLRDVRSDIL